MLKSKSYAAYLFELTPLMLTGVDALYYCRFLQQGPVWASKVQILLTTGQLVKVDGHRNGSSWPRPHGGRRIRAWVMIYSCNVLCVFSRILSASGERGLLWNNLWESVLSRGTVYNQAVINQHVTMRFRILKLLICRQLNDLFQHLW